MGQNIEEFKIKNLWKTAFKKLEGILSASQVFFRVASEKIMKNSLQPPQTLGRVFLIKKKVCRCKPYFRRLYFRRFFEYFSKVFKAAIFKVFPDDNYCWNSYSFKQFYIKVFQCDIISRNSISDFTKFILYFFSNWKIIRNISHYGLD